MKILPFKNKIIYIAIVLQSLVSVSFLFAQQKASDSTAPAEKELSSLQQEARIYRAQGLRLQQAGDINGALILYQKTVDMDPLYAVAFNDLGVIYETKGELDRAEGSYIKAITLDPVFLSAYTNLALFYENKRDLRKAAYYWKIRAELGAQDDPWTEKARQRLEDIKTVSSVSPAKDARETEVVSLLSDVSVKKAELRKNDKFLALDYFQKARLKFKKGDEVGALKLAIDAMQLDPENTEIIEFIDKTQERLLSK